MKYGSALYAAVPGELEQVTVRQQRTGGGVQLQKAVDGALGEAHGHGGRLCPPVALRQAGGRNAGHDKQRDARAAQCAAQCVPRARFGHGLPAAK